MCARLCTSANPSKGMWLEQRRSPATVWMASYTAGMLKVFERGTCVILFAVTRSSLLFIRLCIACGSRRQHSHVVSARSLCERNSPVVSASSPCDQDSRAHFVGCLGIFQIRSGFPLCSFGSAAVSGFWHDGLCKQELSRDTLLMSTANLIACSTPPASAA